MKRILCVLTMLLAAVCFADGAGMAPINPAFLKWKARKERREAEKAAQTNQVSRRLLTMSNAQTVEEDTLVEIEGDIPTIVDFGYLNNLNGITMRGLGETLPAKYDPRPNGVMPPKHQDPNNEGWGTCWAQASIGSMETWLAKIGIKKQLSVRNLVNLNGWDTDTTTWGKGWNGGNYMRSSAYFLRWGGPVLETEDPYTNSNGKVNGTTISKAFTPQFHAQQTRIVPARTGALDNDTIKKAIMAFGGVYATMKLYGYASYVPYWNKNGAYCCTESGAGHAVTVLGWDDNYAKENFNASCRPSGNGAFIVRDSYGNEYPRDNGYIYVSYYDTTFFYTAGCAFPLLEQTDNYDTVYQYDPLGWVTSWAIPAGSGYVYTSGYCANIFTANQAENLSAIGFYATIPSETYTISVYTGCSTGNPMSGSKIHTQTGTTSEFAGYHTIPLSEALKLTKGTRFSVVLYLKTPGAYPFAIEYAEEGYTSSASANAGQSMWSLNASTWYDLTTTVVASGNFCVKAYAKSSVQQTKVLDHITCYSSDNSTTVASGKTKQFTCKATYSDGSEKEVTPTWSITSGGSYGSISSSGLFTAANVTSEQSVGVKASYTEGGVTKTSSFMVTITVAAPNAPTGLTATAGTESSCVRLAWTAVDGATGYTVHRATGSGASSASAKSLGCVDQPKYADTDATPGVDYTYFVKAKNGSGTSGFSSGASGWRALAAPTDVAASDGTSTDYVKVGWGEVSGATVYRVYRGTTEENLTALSGWITDLAYTDTTATPGTLYYYAVKAALDAAGTRASELSIPDTGVREKTNVPESMAISGPSTLASGAQGSYTANVRWSNGDSATCVPTWTCEGKSSTVSPFVYTAPVVSASKTVTLAAKATVEGVALTATQTITVSPSITAAPSAPTISATTTSGISLSWTSVSGASSYVVYRGTTTASSSAAKIGTATGTTFTDTSVTPGQTVYYFLAAVNAAGTSALSAASSSVVRSLAAPTGVTASNGTYTDKVRVTWTTVVGASHYRVSRATSSTGSQTDLGSWQSGTTYDDTSATAGTTYYYFVRAATSSSGANVSAKSSPGAKGLRKVAVTLSSLTISGSDRVKSGESSLYAAKATYSDGTSKTVSPGWSIASGTAATIDAAGKLTAVSVTSDATVTIQASFTEGGVTKTATKSVSVIAPRVASVSVSNVKTTSRWPWKPIVDVDYTITASPADTKATITVEARDEDRLKDLKPAALSGDGATGSVGAGAHRISWNVAEDYPNFNASKVSIDVKASVAAVGAPTDPSASAGTYTDKVVVSWTAVGDAAEYEVWRSTTSTTNSATRLTTVTTTSYSDTSASAGTTYYYWIKSKDDSSTSDFSTVITGYRNVAAPSGVTATVATSTANVTVSWSAVTGASTYEVYRGTSTTYSSATRLTTTTSTSYSDTSATAGTKYYYWVRAVCAQGTGSVSSYTTGRRLVSAPTNVTASDGTSTSSVSLSWSSATGASSYQIWRNTTSWNSSASKIGTATTTSYTDSTATPGITYYYWVKSVDAYGSVSGMGLSNSGYKVLVAPTGIAATSGTSISLTWNAVANAAKYSLWRSQSNSSSTAQKIGEVTTNAATDTSATPGVTYYYWVKAVGANGSNSAFSSTCASGCATLGTPQNVVAADNASSDYLRVTWDAVPGATEYVLYRDVDSSWADASWANMDTFITNLTTTSYNDVFAAPGKTYHYAVCAKRGTLYGTRSVKDAGVRKESTAPYLVFDLSGGTNVERFAISYLSDVPTGGWTDEYKTTKLVFRRIPAGTFKMWLGWYNPDSYVSSYDTVHCPTNVTITEDYYFSIFELTQKQLQLIVGWSEIVDYGAKDNDTLPWVRPSEWGSGWRESVTGLDCGGADSRQSSPFFIDSNIESGGLFGVLRRKTDFAELTLPTISQWEYAGRGGSIDDYNTGISTSAMSSAICKIGRFLNNVSDGKPSGTNGLAKVGCYDPNGFGIYDIHGNAAESVLDVEGCQSWYYGSYYYWYESVTRNPFIFHCDGANQISAYYLGGCFARDYLKAAFNYPLEKNCLNTAGAESRVAYGLRLSTFNVNWFAAGWSRRGSQGNSPYGLKWMDLRYNSKEQFTYNVYRSTKNSFASASLLGTYTNLHSCSFGGDLVKGQDYYFWVEISGGRLAGLRSPAVRYRSTGYYE